MQIIYDLEAGALIDVRVGDAQLAETLLGLPLGEGDVLLNDRGFPRRVGIATCFPFHAAERRGVPLAVLW